MEIIQEMSTKDEIKSFKSKIRSKHRIRQNWTFNNEFIVLVS